MENIKEILEKMQERKNATKNVKYVKNARKSKRVFTEERKNALKEYLKNNRKIICVNKEDYIAFLGYDFSEIKNIQYATQKYVEEDFNVSSIRDADTKDKIGIEITLN